MKPFDNVVVSATEPNNKADVWIQHSKNILDKNTFVVGLVNETGGEQGNLDWRKSGYIEVKPGLNICFSQTTKGQGQIGIVQYDSNKSFISVANKRLTDGSNFLALKLEETTSFVRVQYQVINENENYKLEYGTEPTVYEPYIVDDLLVNDNGVYKSVLTKEIKTGIEIKTNKKVDGKDIYYKKINLGIGPNATSKAYSIGINFSNIVDANVFVKGSANCFKLPFLAQDAREFINYYFQSNQIIIQAGKDRSKYNFYLDIYYTK